MIKKTFTIILIVLLILFISIFSYIFTQNLKFQHNNVILTKTIEQTNKNNNNIINEIEKYNNELNDLKDKLKDKISEYEVWKETKEKIKKITG